MVDPNRKSFAEHCIEHRPELMKEWHPDNTISPYDIARSSSEKVKWRCSVNSSHPDWKAQIVSRVYGKRGCPECSKIKRVITYQKNILKSRGSLADTRPDIAKEWHPTLNAPLTPNDVTAGSKMEVKWQCPKRKDHVYPAVIDNRTSKNDCNIWIVT